jgi:uncharacterized membrane protein HdeD (DUF308 family)
MRRKASCVTESRSVASKRLEGLLTPWTRPCPDSIGKPTSEPEPPPADDESTIELPIVGTVDARALGMPLFTLASGLPYFAFMAAWLNVFEWFGYVRPVQVALGLLAIFVGVIHVKDFFTFHAGVTLSIPEAAKPGIYQRMRRIVTAENLIGAVVGAFVLAVLVNVVELLCTAGLPALYTNILSRQGYSAAVRYGYRGLYILAYMFDDAVMVAGVVATLSRFKLQETGGRQLKLVSGGVILLLGLVTLLRPEWLD